MLGAFKRRGDEKILNENAPVETSLPEAITLVCLSLNRYLFVSVLGQHNIKGDCIDHVASFDVEFHCPMTRHLHSDAFNYIFTVAIA